MSHTDDEFENLQDYNTVLRSAILDSNEMLGLGIEVLTLVQAAIDNGTANNMPIQTQYQVRQTLMYMKIRKHENDQYRNAGDPPPRTFEQYEHP
ncbi:hypothetical protein [Pantoea piersonii]|uniref:hypothetical protein n=1 Tax=Pantoea piersonii TaxID=2364647 RepID=UPI0028B19A03|nr:hypothetical protein [Pantoea piersonii]